MTLKGLTVEQCDYLTKAGVVPKLHRTSLQDYPAAHEFLSTSEFQDFQFGRCGLLVEGGYQARTVATLFTKAFLLSGHDGIVTTPLKLTSLLMRQEIHDDEQAGELLRSKVLCVLGLQKDKGCPMNDQRKEMLEDYLIDRLGYDDLTVLHTTERKLDWYSSEFQGFVDDACFRFAYRG